MFFLLTFTSQNLLQLHTIKGTSQVCRLCLLVNTRKGTGIPVSVNSDSNSVRGAPHIRTQLLLALM